MQRCDYIIDYEDVAEKPIKETISKLKKIIGIRVNQCSILDLVFCEGEPIYTGNGVYFFKTEEKIIYVGSCSARNFVERIPAHFDIRSIGWFNSLLKVVAKTDGRFSNELKLIEKKRQNGKLYFDYTNDLLARAGRIAFEKYSLVLINFKDQYPHPLGVATITALESFLLASDILQPENRTKRKWVYEESRTLKEILEKRVESNLDRLNKRKKKVKTKDT